MGESEYIPGDLYRIIDMRRREGYNNSEISVGFIHEIDSVTGLRHRRWLTTKELFVDKDNIVVMYIEEIYVEDYSCEYYKLLWESRIIYIAYNTFGNKYGTLEVERLQ